MGEAYPELKAKQSSVEKALRDEEQQFARTLENGMAILEKAIANLNGDTLAGETVFKLYDTYGFPVDLTADVARESGITLDMEGFEAAMQVQRAQARAAGNFSAVDKLELDGVEVTDFRGYEALEASGDVAAIYVNGKPQDSLKAGEAATLVLTSSPFYGESGGQIGDSGTLFAEGVEFRVDDTQKQNDVLLHIGELVIGSLKVGDALAGQVEASARKAITLNHSATHLMHAALRNTLGEHVTQKGSLVDATRLRFDFSHSAPVTADELAKIEAAVNAEILANTQVAKEVMALEAAQQRGAMALFGEKYGDEVRVVSMGGKFSVEFCGGTHVERTGDIGLFKILSESGISAGVRRIEAVTGQGALALVAREEQTLKQLCELVKANQDDLLERVKQMNATNKALEKELDQLKAKMASSAGSDLAASAKEVGGIKLLACAVDDFDPKALRETVDQLKNKLGTAVVLLISTAGGKVSIVAGVSKDLTDRIKAGELANMVATQVGGKGGGRPDMAMAGGSDVEAVPAAVASVEEWVANKL
jgi:alanyl-tRNA synthetase